MDDSKSKSGSNVRRNRRSKSSHSEIDEKKVKRMRSNSYKIDSENGRSPRQNTHNDSRSASKSRSYTPRSRSRESSYSRSYRSRSISRSPNNLRRRKSKHRRRSRSWSNNSSLSFDDKDNSKASPSSRQSKDRKKIKDPRDKSKRETWKNKVYIVGEIMKDSIFHFCDTCQMPIFIYCRLIPCKHIFCFTCGTKYQDKKCPRCDKKVLQTERCNFGTIFMCYQGGAQHGSQGCRRTYLSQRDLDSHINHRHSKSGNAVNQPLNSACSIMSLSGPQPLGMLGPTFINSFPGQFQQQQIQSLIQQQQMPINQIQNQQMTPMNPAQASQMIRPMGNILGNMNSQSLSVNQQQINPSQSQMVNHSQNFSLQIPPMNMISCNMNQNTLSMVNQNTQNITSAVMTNVTNNQASQLGVPNNNMVPHNNNMFMHAGGVQNNVAGNHMLMRGGINQGYNGTGHQPPLMAHLSTLIQGMSHSQQQQQSQVGRQFQDLQRQLQLPSSMQNQSGWINQAGQINPGSNN